MTDDAARARDWADEQAANCILLDNYYGDERDFRHIALRCADALRKERLAAEVRGRAAGLAEALDLSNNYTIRTVRLRLVERIDALASKEPR